MDDHYYTIAEKSLGIYKEKGSKFIAVAIAVQSAGQAMERLQEIKKEYHDARHHCYAYRIGFEGDEYRMNDDGEPSGTAGKPIYGQLLSVDVTNILIVVVRYFGGTKLGVSGLIRAYKSAAQDALQNGQIVQKTIVDVFEIIFPYEQMNAVMKLIKDEDLEVLKRDFNLTCKLAFQLKISKSESIRKKMQKINNLIISHLHTK
jgi:uncharacterized YigZ family protein